MHCEGVVIGILATFTEVILNQGASMPVFGVAKTRDMIHTSSAHSYNHL
jgi:hypothetical protein